MKFNQPTYVQTIVCPAFSSRLSKLGGCTANKRDGEDRLRELLPELGEASLYRTRDLIPERLMTPLSQGKVIVLNWHQLARQSPQQNGTPVRVVRAGLKKELPRPSLSAQKQQPRMASGI